MKYKIVEDPKKLCVKCPQSLKEKVFIPKNANCQYSFTLGGQLGESLWNKTLRKLKIRDFIFFDPYNRECPAEYNSFFDPHLRDHFRRKSVLNHLQRSHLITDRGEVICTIGEYNEFRKCMHRLIAEGNGYKQKNNNHRDVMRHQMEINHANLWKQLEKNQKFRERYKMDKSDDPASILNTTRNLKGKRIKMEEEKRAKFMNDLKVYEDRVKKINHLKLVRENELKERGLYRNLELVKKQIFVLEKRKQRRAKIKKAIFEREEAVKKRLSVDNPSEPINYIIRCPFQI